jgi:large subunit ribosomal protein L35
MSAERAPSPSGGGLERGQGVAGASSRYARIAIRGVKLRPASWVCAAITTRSVRSGGLYLQDVTNMPKMKTHKGASRRMKYSGAGKLMRTRQGKSHLRRNKSKRAAGEFDEMFVVAKPDLPRLQRLLPYGKKFS